MLVVKLGGGADLDATNLLAELATLDEPWILVHGGNAELNALSERLGHSPRFVTSPSGHTSRVTDAQTMALIQMAYRGRINNDLVLRLQRLGCNAVGLSGVDGRIWQASRKEAIRVVENGKKFLLRDDLTGKIHSVNTHLLQLLLDGGYRPVLTLPALGDATPGNADAAALNVDGDRAAGMVAAAMGARALVILSNVPGLLRNIADPASLVTTMRADPEDPNLAYAEGRFKKKLLGAMEAIHGGVGQVIIGTAHGETPLAAALSGKGTVMRP